MSEQAAALPTDPVAEAHGHWVDRGWEAAADGMATVTSVMRTAQIMLARVDAVLRPDLTFARYEVLMLLAFSRHGALPMSRIGARLQVHPASVTGAVARLEADGLVRRQPHPHDRRRVLASLTDAGRAQAMAATERLNAEVFADLGIEEEELATLGRVLRAFRSAAGDF